MLISRVDEYTEEEYITYRQRYDALPKKERDFEILFGNQITGEQFEQFIRKRVVTPTLMALLLNIIQNEDEVNFERGHSMYYDLVEIDYEQAGKHRCTIMTENLLQRQLNIKEILYLVVLVQKIKKGFLSDDRTWQMALIRLPTKQLRLFVNADKNTQQFETEWSYLQDALANVHQMSFKGFRQDQLLLKNSEGSKNGALPILNVLLKFIQGYQLEKIVKDQLNEDDTYRRLVWLLLKIKFGEAVRKKRPLKDDDLEQYKYEHPIEMYLGQNFHPDTAQQQREQDEQRQKLSLLTPKSGRTSKKILIRGERRDRREVGVQTFISIDPLFQLDYLKFNDHKTRLEIECNSKGTITDAIPVKELPYFDIENIKKMDRPYLRNHVWRSQPQVQDVSQTQFGTVNAAGLDVQQYPTWSTNRYVGLQKYVGHAISQDQHDHARTYVRNLLKEDKFYQVGQRRGVVYSQLYQQ